MPSVWVMKISIKISYLFICKAIQSLLSAASTKWKSYPLERLEAEMTSFIKMLGIFVI